MADIQGGSNQTHGDTPHDTGDAGNPIKIGGKAATALPTAVADQDRVDAYFDENGVQRVGIQRAEALIATGTITALNGTVEIDVRGYSAVGLQLTGTWVATIEFQVTVDGTNWVPVEGVGSTGGVGGTETPFNGVLFIACPGAIKVRVEATAFTSGTVQVDMRAVLGAGRQATGATVSVVEAVVEDAPHVSGDKGFLLLGVRRDTPSSIVDADGDNMPLTMDPNGFLYVGSFAGSQRISDTLDSLNDTVEFFAESSSSIQVEIRSGLTGTVVLEVSMDGTVWIAQEMIDVGNDFSVVSSVVNPSGETLIATVAGWNKARLRVSLFTSGSCIGLMENTQGVNAVTIANLAIGPRTLGKREDDAHVSGDAGVQLLGVRRDADTSPVDADGDYQPALFDANGMLKVAVATKTILSVQRHYTGNQTDTLLIEGSGVTLKIHSIVVLMNASNDANIAVRIGLDPTTTPANDSAKMAFSHPGMHEGDVADRSIGGGVPVVEGAVGDDLRITTLIDSDTDGDYDVLVTYESVS